MNDNPYASPVDSLLGHFDHSLLKRFLFAVSMLAIIYLLASAVGCWQLFRKDPNHRHEPVVSTVVEFVSDWRDGNGLD